MPTIAQGSDEMESKIDWSKAPDWAKKHGLSGAFKSPVWFDDKKYTYVDGQQDGKEFFYTDACTYAAKDFSQVSERPTTPSWSGEGLPPVGVDIEVLHELYGWIGARVVGQDGEAAIVRTNDGYAGAFQHQMRPIRTPEQIAADERERFAQELVAVMGKGDGPNALYQARRMYDLGYRKQ